MSKVVLTKQTGDYWSFVVDGDTANEILNTRNDLLVYGNYCHFKTANGANLIQKQDILPTDVTIIGSQTYNPVDKHTLFADLISEGYFDWILGGDGTGGTGVNRFDHLLDTFQYTGKNGMVVVVDESQLRLIAVPFHNVSKTTDLSDMPQTIVGNQMLITDPTGTFYEYQNIPKEPDTFLNSVGYFIYEDAATQAIPIAFSNGVTIVIPNDGAGNETDTSQAPFAVGKIWNTVTNEMDFSDLSIGDTVDLRIRLEVDPTTNSQKYQIILTSAIGSPSEEQNVIFTEVTKSAGTDTMTFTTMLAINNSDVQNYPAQLSFVSDSNGTLKVFKFLFRILRKNINLVEIGAAGLDLKEDKANKQPIFGNETNTKTFPSTADVVNYLATYGAHDLESVLKKGNVADQPILLQTGDSNYFSYLHPNIDPYSFQAAFASYPVVGSYTNTNLFVHTWNSSGYGSELSQDTETDLSATSLKQFINVISLICTYTNKSTNSITQYSINIEKDNVYLQKKINNVASKFRLKLDNLTADRTGQMQDKDGTFAYLTDIPDITTLTTDNIPEGVNPNRLYFLASRVLATILTGLVTTNSGTVSAADTILQAFGKLQAQMNLKAIDSLVVHLAGSETITGVKTFSAFAIFSAGLRVATNNSIRIGSGGYTYSPDSNYAQILAIGDHIAIASKGSTAFAMISTSLMTNNRTYVLPDKPRDDTFAMISDITAIFNGTSSQFVKGDGSLDSTIYLTASFNIRNQTGATLTQGTIVQVNSISGGVYNVSKANANAYIVGQILIVNADIPNNATGIGVSSGTFTYNTASMTPNDTLYVGLNGLIQNNTSGLKAVITIGNVLTSATSGSVFLDVKAYNNYFQAYNFNTSNNRSEFSSDVSHLNNNILAVNNITANSFIKQGGTASQFLKADGSVDNNVYLIAITSSNVITALGFTPMNPANNLSEIVGKSQSRLNLGIDGRITVGDIDYTIANYIKEVATNVRFTTSHTWILPSDGNPSSVLMIVDEAQAITAVNTLTIFPPSGKSLNGTINGSIILNATGAIFSFITDGQGNWFYDAGMVRTNAPQIIQNKTILMRNPVYLYNANITPNLDTTDILRIDNVTGNINFVNPIGTAYSEKTLLIKLYGSGSVNLTFDTNYIGTSLCAIPTSAVLSSTGYRIGLRYNSANTKWEFEIVG